jgi:ATP-binding cassette, subfamily B, bacterial PglK
MQEIRELSLTYFKKYLSDISDILGKESLRTLVLIVSLFLLLAMFDVLGIGFIVAFIGFFLGDNSETVKFIYPILEFFGGNGEFDRNLLTIGGLLIALYLLKTGLAMAINVYIIHFGFRQQVRLRTCLINAYFHMPYQSTLGKNSASLIYSIVNLTAQFTSGVLLVGLKMISDLVLGGLIVIFLFLNEPGILLVMLGILLLVAWVFDKYFRERLRKKGELEVVAQESLTKSIQESAQGVKEIRTLGIQKEFIDRVSDFSEQYAEAGKFVAAIQTFPKYFLEFVVVSFIVGTAVVLVYAGQTLPNIGTTLSLFGVAALRLLPAVNSSLTGLASLRTFRFATGKLKEGLEEDKQGRKLPNTVISSDAPNIEEEHAFRSLKIENLGFRYSGANEEILTNVSLGISAGDVVGISGPSGSGKTTLIDLILGLLEPSTGEIYVNDQPLVSMKSVWQRHVTYLSQAGFLIDGSLFENITMGVKGRLGAKQDLVSILDRVQLADFYNGLPNGLNTLVGERGSRVSGGERQRVSLARALFFQRDILVMDESTNALDEETERNLLAELAYIKGKGTVIIVSHKPSVLENCDYVFCVNSGRVTLDS